MIAHAYERSIVGGGADMRCARANELHPLSAASRELMGTNAGWPEAFGFSVSGGAPVVIRAVEEGGSAQAAGLQPGDVIAELDGEDVQQWTLQQVKFLLFLRTSSLWSSSDLYCRCC